MNKLAGVDARFVPLHGYFIQALDLLWAHLKNNAPLPPSQVVHATPRSVFTAPGTPLIGITAVNASQIVPPISPNPPAHDRITFDGRVLYIPD